MKNKYIKRVLSLFLALLILSPISLGLDRGEKLEKEEIIYGKIDFNGESDLLIAVSGFPAGFKGKDYGDFSEVANLSTPEELVYQGGSIDIDAKENFYYQGKLKTKDLPWHISLRWTLDGKPIAEEDLLGKSGHLKLVYDLRPNPACCSKYFDYYIVQSGFHFNVDQVRNLVAPDGTEATAGSVKMVNFMSFPGQKSTYIIEADVDDYEPGMIQIGALPLNLALDLSEISEYTGDLKTLELAIAQLNGGTWEFLDGLYQIKEGATTYKNAGQELLDGLDQLSGGLNEITDGSSQIREGLEDYSEGMTEFEDGILQLTGGLSGFLDGIGDLGEGSEDFTEGLLLYFEAIESFVDYIEANSEEIEEIIKGAQDLIRALEKADISLKQLAELKENLDNLSNLLDPALFDIDEARLDSVIAGLNNSISDLIVRIDNLRGIKQGLLEITVPSLEGEDTALAQEVSLYYKKAIEAEAAKLDAEIGELVRIKDDISMQKAALLLFKNDFLVVKGNISKLQRAIEAVNLLLDNLDLGDDVDLVKLSEGIEKIIKDSEGLLDTSNGLADGLGQLEDFIAGGNDLSEGAKAIREGIKRLIEGAQGFEGFTKDLEEGVKELGQGARTLSREYQQFDDGIRSLASGLGSFNNGLVQYVHGFWTLHQGLQDLYIGGLELGEGTSQMAKETKDIDKKMEEEIKNKIAEMSAEGIEFESFLSPKNKDISSVQFVLLYEGRTLPLEDNSDNGIEKKTILDRFLDLFKKAE